MSGAKVELHIEGAAGVSRSMDALTNHLGTDLTRMFVAIQDWWHVWQGEVFDSEGAELSQWEPLSDKYKKWKDVAYPGKPILELTGKMRGAMTGNKSDGAWSEVGKRDLKIGISDIPYWAAHNFGYENIPMRKFLDASEEAIVDLDKRLQDVLKSIKSEMLGALDRTIMTGSRGGKYYLTGSGKKVYVSKGGGLR